VESLEQIKDVKDESLRAVKHQMVKLRQIIRHLDRENRYFEMLIDSLPGVFYVFDENLHFHRWNMNVERVTGYSPSEIRQMSILDLFEGEDKVRMREVLYDVFTRDESEPREAGEGNVEANLVGKSGISIPHIFTGVSTKIDGVSYLLGMGLDISEIKEAQEALKESEALYRTLADRMTEGVLLFVDEEILFVNQTFVGMFGFADANRVVGRNVSDLFAVGFETRFRAMYENLLTGRSLEENFQTRWVTREGRTIWVNGRSNLLQWRGRLTVLLTARDVTEAKLREISMQEEAENLRRENVTLRSSMRDRYRLGDIIGKSSVMQRVYQLILNAAASQANTIIYGESGTGKELIARAIHQMSSRADKPLVPVNCAAIPENLLESEFFGHVKGAFTGAHTNKRGYLDRANGGTLFLDEIGALDPNLQAKLLRAIEGGGFSPVGSNQVKNSDFRILAATNVDLLEQSKIGLFRQDFFFRIYIIPINVPPLRKRKEDIPLLVEHYLAEYSGGKPAHPLPGRVLEALVNYDWPGNVRELQNVLQRYLTVGRLDFMPELGRTETDPVEDIGFSFSEGTQDLRLKEMVERVERAMIQETLTRCRSNKSRAAATLGVTRKTLARKMRLLGLS